MHIYKIAQKPSKNLATKKCHAVVQSCSLAVEKLIQCLDRMTLRLQDRKTKSRECGFLCCPVPSSPRLRRTKQVSLLRPEFSGLRWVNFSPFRAIV